MGLLTIPACPGHVCFFSFNKGSIERTISLKICFMFVHVCFVLCRDQFWGFNYQKERVYIYIYEKFYMKYAFACDEFDYPEVTMSGLRDVKIHLWLNQPPLLAHEIWQHSLHPFPEDTSAKKWYKGQIAFYFVILLLLVLWNLFVVTCWKSSVYLLLNVALRIMRWCCCSWAKCGNEMLDVGCHSLNHLVLIFCSIQVHCNTRCEQPCYHTVVAWISVMCGTCYRWSPCTTIFNCIDNHFT